MPRFFFHAHDGKGIPDHQGVELPDWTTARLRAIAMAGRIFAETPERVELGKEWSMSVTDSTGLLLFLLDFHIDSSPAVRNDRLAKER